MKASLALILSAAAISACASGLATSSQFSRPDRRSEFEYRRAHAATGQFLTADALKAHGDVSLLEILSTYVLGFPLAGDGRRRPGSTTSCTIEVYVDGLRAAEDLDVLRPRDLLGVEYYTATNAPVKYRRAFSDCPVLLVWLRDD
jgi:hypothetical protein